jgi:transcriptional regulator with XRE-family HTH domain
MDLDEYIFYENRKDKRFSKKAFAEKLGIDPKYFLRVASGKMRPSSELAYKIEQLTEGKVSGWELIKSHITKNLPSK